MKNTLYQCHVYDNSAVNSAGFIPVFINGNLCKIIEYYCVLGNKMPTLK
jgi:hypothetical protein